METGHIVRGAVAALPGWKAWNEGQFQVSDDGKLRVESAEQWLPFLLAPALSLSQSLRLMADMAVGWLTRFCPVLDCHWPHPRLRALIQPLNFPCSEKNNNVRTRGSHTVAWK